MNPETQQRLAEIEEREQKATAGPWDIEYPSYNPNAPLTIIDVHGESVVSEAYEPEASFMCHSRADIPWLLQLVKEQQGEIERKTGALEAMFENREKWRESHGQLEVENQRLQAENQRLVEALKRVQIAFGCGDLAHTSINGKGHYAIELVNEALAERSGSE